MDALHRHRVRAILRRGEAGHARHGPGVPHAFLSRAERLDRRVHPGFFQERPPGAGDPRPPHQDPQRLLEGQHRLSSGVDAMVLKMKNLLALSVFLLGLGPTGCRKDNKNPFLTTPASSVTSATLHVRQIDTADTPEERILVQVLSNAGIPITDFQLGNFSILEDGKPGVPYESGLANDPLSIALII